MDISDPAAVFSSVEERGGYGYANQPHDAAWNLARFGETMLPLIDSDAQRAVDAATEAISKFASLYADCWLAGMRRRLGLATPEPGDRQLAEDLLEAMHRNQADFTETFRQLCAAAEDPKDERHRGNFINARNFKDWAHRWRT